MAHVEVCNEAAVHDELPLQIVHHTKAHTEAYEDVCPVKCACIPVLYMPLPSCKKRKKKKKQMHQ